jgi:hypothetical protein
MLVLVPVPVVYLGETDHKLAARSSYGTGYGLPVQQGKSRSPRLGQIWLSHPLARSSHWWIRLVSASAWNSLALLDVAPRGARLDLRGHGGFERNVRHKATSFRALHLFLRGCERQLVNPVIALAIAHQPWGSLLDLCREPSIILSRTAGRCGSNASVWPCAITSVLPV